MSQVYSGIPSENYDFMYDDIPNGLTLSTINYDIYKDCKRDLDEDNWSTIAECENDNYQNITTNYISNYIPIPVKKPYIQVYNPAPKKNQSCQIEASEKRKLKEEKKKMKEEKMNKKITRNEKDKKNNI
jgi:hypothetical protein